MNWTSQNTLPPTTEQGFSPTSASPSISLLSHFSLLLSFSFFVPLSWRQSDNTVPPFSFSLWTSEKEKGEETPQSRYCLASPLHQAEPPLWRNKFKEPPVQPTAPSHPRRLSSLSSFSPPKKRNTETAGKTPVQDDKTHTNTNLFIFFSHKNKTHTLVSGCYTR